MAASALLELAVVPNRIFLWGMLISASIFAFFTIVIPAMIFIVALLQSKSAATYPPLNEEPGSRPAIDETVRLGFTVIGHFRAGDSGIAAHVKLTLAVSGDARMLLVIRHNASGAMTFMSRFASGRWMLTTNFPSRGDEALELVELVHAAKMEPLLLYHEMRLASFPEHLVPFVPATVTADLTAHHRAEMEQQVAVGLARYASKDRSTIRSTLRGAMRRALGFATYGLTARKRAAEAQAKVKQLEWGLVKDGIR